MMTSPWQDLRFAARTLVKNPGFSLVAILTDPAVFVSVGALLSFVAFVACCVPAHRATRLDPVAALRQD